VTACERISRGQPLNSSTYVLVKGVVPLPSGRVDTLSNVSMQTSWALLYPHSVGVVHM
jgi:hypothetical protein